MGTELQTESRELCSLCKHGCDVAHAVVEVKPVWVSWSVSMVFVVFYASYTGQILPVLLDFAQLAA